MMKNKRISCKCLKKQSLFLRIYRTACTLPVLLYQKTLSPDHGLFKGFFPYGFCPYYPSCSEYTRQTILNRGIVKGILFGGFRILRCNPWSKGGIDKVQSVSCNCK